jgi:hypothetical protein
VDIGFLCNSAEMSSRIGLAFELPWGMAGEGIMHKLVKYIGYKK